MKNRDSWKDIFINENRFDESYKFGVGTREHEFYDTVKLCHHIIIDFENHNFTTYVVSWNLTCEYVVRFVCARTPMIHLTLLFAVDSRQPNNPSGHDLP